MLLVSYWLTAAILGFLSHVTSKNIHEYQLRAKLFRNYSTHVSPQPINKPVDVSFNIAFACLTNLDVKKEEISINIWQRQYWNDARLAWTPTENGNITQLGALLTEIWTPDIYLYYSSGNVNKFGKNIPGSLPFSATLYASGLLFFTQPVTIYAPCEVDVGFYPFDDQICKLEFGTWSQDLSVVRMLLHKGGIDLSNYLKHNEWEIVSVKPSIQTVQLNSDFAKDHGHAVVVYTIHLRRQALFYMINYILPSIIIAILSLLLFLIPPEVGKRMEAGINLLLCLSVYLMLVNSKMPLSSKSFPLLTKFYGCTIMILVVSLCCSCWVYSYYFMNPSGWDIYYLPAFLEKIIFNFLGPAFHLPSCKSLHLKATSNSRHINGKCHENQALDEGLVDNGLQLKESAEASQDQSRSEVILSQRSSALAGWAVSVQLEKDAQSKSEMITSQRSSSLVDGAVAVRLEKGAESSTGQSKSGITKNQGSNSLTDGADSAEDRQKEVDFREEEFSTMARDSDHAGGEAKSNLVDEAVSSGKKGNLKKGEECATVNGARNSGHGEEEAKSNLVDKDVSGGKKGKKGNLRKEEDCATVNGACNSGRGEEEAMSNLVDEDASGGKKRKKRNLRKEDETATVNGACNSGRGEEDGSNSDQSKKKKKKKKKKASKLFRQTIAVKKIVESFDQHIKESSGMQQDDGDASCDNSHETNNHQGDNVDTDHDNSLQKEEECFNEASASNLIEASTNPSDLLPDSLSLATAVPSDPPPNPDQNRHLLFLAQSSQEKDQKFVNTERWKLAAIILDRLFIILLVVSIVASFLACFLSSPRVRTGLI